MCRFEFGRIEFSSLLLLMSIWFAETSWNRLYDLKLRANNLLSILVHSWVRSVNISVEYFANCDNWLSKAKSSIK
jgi:hypothetical protein